jgi:capsular polysaccharide biosynthesis protein/Mrp family chromosome partitioning ATPase
VNLKTFLAAVRMYWKTFAVVTVTVLALGLSWLLLTPIPYVSTTQLLVTIGGSTTAEAYQNDNVVSGRINSYITLLTSDVVSQRVVDDLGLHMTAGQLAAKVSAADVPPKTSIIDVAVTDESPEQARRIADTLGREFVSYTDALETPTGEDGQKVHTTIVTAASEPHSRLALRVGLGVLAALAALLLGAVAVWIRSLTDPVVRTANRAAAAAGVPVLGCVTAKAAASAGELEGYRRLRTRLRSTTGTGGGRLLELASVDGGVDATKVASNLGRVMELADSRSIVIDADSADSPVRAASATEKEPDQVDGDDYSSRSYADGDGRGSGEPVRAVDGFPDTLSASGWATEPDRVATKAASGLVERLRGDYEHVIIAAPPVLSTLTASAVSEYADAVVLLVCRGRTKRRDVLRAAESLRATGAPLIGVVLVGKDLGRGESAARRPAQALGLQRSEQSAPMS